MIKSILNLVFPKYCLSCGHAGEYLCYACLGRLVVLDFQTCANCRRRNRDGRFCGGKCARGYHFERLLVCMGYGKDSILKRLVVLYKYKFSRELSEILGKVMRWQFAKFSHEFGGSLEPALIMPVPLHKKRYRYRGFNQAGLLAEELSKHFSNLEFRDYLARRESTEAQAGLGRSDRLVNVRGTIAMKDGGTEVVTGRTIVLVDDIATTCSTLNECSRVLMESGAERVCCLVLARGWLFC